MKRLVPVLAFGLGCLFLFEWSRVLPVEAQQPAMLVHGNSSGTIVPLAVNSTGNLVVGTGSNSIGTVVLGAGSAAVGTIALGAGSASVGTVNLSTADPCQAANVVKSSAVINVTTDAELVALTSGQTIYVCGYEMTVGGTAPTYRFVYGTGTTCATGLTGLTGTYLPVVGADDSYGPGSTVFATIASNALCMDTGGTSPSAQGVLTYVKQVAP